MTHFLIRRSRRAVIALINVILVNVVLMLIAAPAAACEGDGAVCPGSAPPAAFALIVDGRPTVVRTDPGDHPGLLRAAADLRLDLERVSGQASSPRHADGNGTAVIVGTLGRNAEIDALVAAGRLDVPDVAGRWEGFVQQVVDDPVPGVERALVIAGSDMRGAIFAGSMTCPSAWACRPGTGGPMCPRCARRTCMSCPAAAPTGPRCAIAASS